MSHYENIVILTGAGISAESGLDTFRDKGGIWSRYDVNDVATPEGFARNPDMVHDFYNQRRRNLLTVKPNAAHAALARLEAEHPGTVSVVTQNIDNLHEQAGSRRVIHMHGELFKIRCQACGVVIAWREDITTTTPCPACDVAGNLRPHVVWFGEMPLEMARIDALLDACNLFLSIGTSGNVYPAAGYVARVQGRAHTVELNLEASNPIFDERVLGRAAEIVPAYVDRLL
jgi:NAD-dependent deacetylase